MIDVKRKATKLVFEKADDELHQISCLVLVEVVVVFVIVI
jgi:hypothetical protein